MSRDNKKQCVSFTIKTNAFDKRVCFDCQEQWNRTFENIVTSNDKPKQKAKMAASNQNKTLSFLANISWTISLTSHSC